MQSPAIRGLAVFGPLIVSIVLVLFFAGVDSVWRHAFSGLALAVVAIALWYALRLSFGGIAGVSSADRRLMQVHIVAHAVPVSFGMVTLSAEAAAPLSPAWSVGFAVFFYTGRKTWLALHTAHPSPVYSIFLRGNTAMLITSIGLALLSALTAHAGLALFAERMLQLYIAAHLLLLTPAVAKLHRDIAG